MDHPGVVQRIRFSGSQMPILNDTHTITIRIVSSSTYALGLCFFGKDRDYYFMRLIVAGSGLRYEIKRFYLYN